MRFTQTFINTVNERADILEVVQDFVSLKKKGQNYWACCPFHHEKSPSFSVSQAKQIYKCFGCGAAGNAIGFVMAIEKTTFPEALKYLANKYSIQLDYEEHATDEEQEAQTQRESLLIALNFAKNHYKTLLHNHAEGKSIGQAYFKERGFSPQTVEAFELGYSLPQWDSLLVEGQKNQFSEEILEQAGLILRNEQGKIYDRFRGRVIFPILDLSGKTIAFGARSLKKDEQPKYLNSPETPVYHKGEMLYGLYQARTEIRKKDNCYLTEGYTDVISMFQSGVTNVVASLGTSLTEKQIRLIRRFTENVTVLYDGDTAGIKASLRGVDMLLAEGLNVKIVLFPEGEDPDSYCQKLDSLAFQAFLEKNSQDFITFKTHLYLQESQNDPLKKATAIREIVQSISKIPDAIKRSVFYQRCAEMMGVSEEVLKKGEKLAPAVQPKLPPVPLAKEPIQSDLLNGEAESLRFLMMYAHLDFAQGTRLCEYFEQEFSDISRSILFDQAFGAIKTYGNGQKLRNHLTETNQSDLLAMLLNLSEAPHSLTWTVAQEPAPKVLIDLAYQHCLYRKALLIDEKIKEVQTNLRNPNSNHEELFEMLDQLGEMKREIVVEMRN